MHAMSIIEKDKVDAIGIEKETGIVVLSIADHLDWTDPLQHIFLLQAKLNSYLAFLESGEILEKYPNAKNKGIRIDLYAKYECSDEKSKKIII